MATKNSEIHNVVKSVREQLGLSQEDLARELGVSFATVNRWENGKVNPSKLGKARFDEYCTKMTRRGALNLTDEDT